MAIWQISYNQTLTAGSRLEHFTSINKAQVLETYANKNLIRAVEFDGE